MNKPELIDAIAEKTNLKKKEAEAVVESLIESIEEALKNGDKVTLIGFGTFGTRKRAGRKGINPKTGEAIEIPAKVVPYFKPGKNLKEIVSQ